MTKDVDDVHSMVLTVVVAAIVLVAVVAAIYILMSSQISICSSRQVANKSLNRGKRRL